MQRILLLFVLHLLLIPATLRAQDIEVVIQSYHTDRVEFIKFSPDGSKIATGGKDKSVKVWETRTSRLICTFTGYLFSVNGCSFSPDGKYLVTEGDIRSFKLWNITNGKEEDFFVTKGLSRDFIHGLAFDSTGKHLLTTNQKGDINLYDFTTRQLLKTFKGPEGRVDKFGFTADNKKVYSFSNTTGAKVINRETGKTELNIATPATASSVAFSTVGDLYAIGHKDGNIEIKNSGNQVVKKLKPLPNPVSELYFSPGGKYLVAGYGMYNYFIWDTKDFNPQFGETRIVYCAFAGNDSIAGVAYKNSPVKIFNANSGKAISISGSIDLQTAMDINASFNYCARLHDDNSVRIHRLADGAEVKVLKRIADEYPEKSMFTADGGISVLYSSGKAYNYSFKDLKQVAVAAPSFEKPGIIHVKKSGDIIYEINSSAIISNTRSGKKNTVFTFAKPVITADITPDGKYIVALTEKNIQVFNPSEKEPKIKYTDGSYGILNLVTSNTNEYLYAVNGLKRLEKYSITQKKKIFEVSDPSGITSIEQGVEPKNYPLLETGNGKYIVHTGENWAIHIRNADGTLFKTLAGHSDYIHHLEFDSAENRLLSASEDGTIILWDWQNGKKLLTLVSSGENWIVLTPENYYFNNKEGYRLVGFKVKDRAVSFEQFDIEFNRPDKVLEKMGGDEKWVKSFYLAYLKRLKKEGVKPGSSPTEISSLPEVIINDINKIPLQTSLASIEFTAKIKGEKINSGKLAVWVNGVPEPVAAKLSTVNETGTKIKVNLSQGNNLIKVAYITDNGMQSAPAGFEINHTPVKPFKPDLYVLCIGVSEYKNPLMNLKYAAKDSRDLVNLLKTSKGFGKITVDTLLDKKATRENIFAWKTKLAKSKADDLVLISLSGHGLLDDSLNFYFATHDIDFKAPKKRGLAYEEIEGLLAGITPRRRLLLMDACHSGEADKAGLEETTEQVTLPNGGKSDIKTYRYRTTELLVDENEITISPFDLMMEMFSNLNQGSGTVVISAAAGNSYALESDAWQNGVFTYSVLEGLQNLAADENKDGKITVSELRKFVSQNVETLTRGRQKPTSRSVNTDADWVVWE